MRSELQKELSAPKSVRSFLLEVDEVTKEFLQFIDTNKIVDILPKLTRLNLECKYDYLKLNEINFNKCLFNFKLISNLFNNLWRTFKFFYRC